MLNVAAALGKLSDSVHNTVNVNAVLRTGFDEEGRAQGPCAEEEPSATKEGETQRH